MATTRDHYDVLGVSRSATADEIKDAFRRLARRYHPDVSQEADAVERFAEATQAYEVLSDAEKRSAYDRFGHAGVSGAGGSGGPSPDLESIFADLFGGGGPFAGGMGGAGMGGGPGVRDPFGARAPRAGRGRDIERNLDVTFRTAARGGIERVTLDGGRGPETIEVRIPQGVESGRRLRVRGRGEPGPGGGQRGDLLLRIEVGAHPWFRRSGLDLEIDVPITVVEAVLGTTVSVPLLDGTAQLAVPPGSSSGRRLRLREKGLTDGGDRTGDLYARIRIDAPAEVSEDARRLLEAVGRDLPSPRQGPPWSDA